MIRYLEDNPVGLVFASVCGGLLVISVLLSVIWSLPPSAPSAEEDGDSASPILEIPVLADAEPLETFAVITERPVFNETRQPVIPGEEDEDGDEDVAEEEVDAPEFQLAGVVITPSIRMATLRQEGAGMSLVAFEGQPLEGDYGSWQVSKINEREVTLTSGGGEELQLKLEVHKAKIAPPPKVAEAEGKKPAASGERGPEEEADAPLTRAEEIRQRIAERREELRRAAEEKEQNGESEPETQDYRSAIQSMMNRRDQNRSSDEDKE
jgi:hypothetical protein